MPFASPELVSLFQVRSWQGHTLTFNHLSGTFIFLSNFSPPGKASKALLPVLLQKTGDLRDVTINAACGLCLDPDLNKPTVRKTVLKQLGKSQCRVDFK